MRMRVLADVVSRAALCFGVSIAVAGFVHNGLSMSEPPAVETAFGVYACHGFMPSHWVPNVEGATFAWRMRVDGDEAVHWREELILPSAPAHWTASDAVIVDEGREAVREGIAEPDDGVIEEGWSVDAGDPSGMYELRLYVNDELVRDELFEVR